MLDVRGRLVQPLAVHSAPVWSRGARHHLDGPSLRAM